MCRVIRFLYRWVPWKFFQDVLLRIHLDNCPFCQESLMKKETVRQMWDFADDEEEDLWPGVWREINKEKVQKNFISRRRFSYRWAFSLALVLTFLGASVVYIYFLPSISHSPSPNLEIYPKEEGHFDLLSAQIEGEPAQVIQLSVEEPGVHIVWVEKT